VLDPITKGNFSVRRRAFRFSEVVDTSTHPSVQVEFLRFPGLFSEEFSSRSFLGPQPQGGAFFCVWRCFREHLGFFSVLSLSLSNCPFLCPNHTFFLDVFHLFFPNFWVICSTLSHSARVCAPARSFFFRFTSVHA